MNYIKFIIGFAANKILAAEAYYRITKYKRKVHGSDYRLNGAVCCSYPENIYIGEGTYINGGELCASPNAKIVIGKHCLISYDFFARTDVHKYADKDVLIQQQGIIEKDIIIGDDVWIGYGVKVMAGVRIADGCVIAAGAVVTHDTEPYCLYAGVPAHRRKQRTEMEYNFGEKQEGTEER